MTSYTSTKDDFGQNVIQPIQSANLKEFKKHDFSQPLPKASDGVILDWAKNLVLESYSYTKDLHERWHKNALDYYTIPTLDSAQRSGRNVSVDGDMDTEIMVPALIKRYVDLGAFWLVREIFKSEPFMQFTSYEMDQEARKAQKLYERKIQGDTETFGAREKALEVFIDLFLYGNGVAKSQFHQERVVTMEIPDLEFNINEPDEEDLTSELSLEDPLANFEIMTGDPFPSFSIIDQYGEFKPIYLGHFIVDPIPPGKDWRRARYMGDVEYVTAEELMERFGDIRGFTSKLKSSCTEAQTTSQIPLTGHSSSFTQSWSAFTSQEGDSSLVERKLHSVTHLYTKYTETIIVDSSIVVYHRYRSKSISKAGAFPYVMFKMPNPTGGLFSTGYGHLLRTLQKEQIILASKRLQAVEDMHRHIMEYVGDAVDEKLIKNIGNLTVIPVETPGAIHPIVPNHQAMEGYLNAEARNFQRAEQYAGVPSILDSSNTKTHLGAVSQRMEAAQVQFDVILDNTRDGFKEIFQKIHIFNMAYLEGDIPIKGSTGPFNKDFTDNVLTEDSLQLLSNQPQLAVQLNLGLNIGTEKLQAFASVVNTNPVGVILQQLQQSGMLTQDKMMNLMGMLFEVGGVSEFGKVFEVTPEDMERHQMMLQQQQAVAAQGPQGMPGEPQGQPPAPGPMM